MAMQRGLDERHEQDQLQLIRDTRTLGKRIADFFKSPTGVGITLVMCAMAGFVVSALTDVIFVIGIIVFMIAISNRAKLPFRLPKRAERKDYGHIMPGGKRKPKMASGIYFFGNDKRTGEELWFSNEDMRTHVLIFGSTGSGKTELLLSLAFNALLQASGFIFVDGKGDNSLFAKVFSMVRYMGREDDLLLINFMTGARDIVGPQKKRLSNTLNPFATGSSSMLSQLVVSMMDQSSQSSDGDMWKGRAIAFIESLMKMLVAMRDAGHILLDANTVRNYFHLNRIEAMVIDKVFIRDDQESISLEGVPDVVLEPIKNYLLNLPGFNRERKNKQVSQVLEQHGFITMQLVRVFTSLADTYGHILRTKLAEVDLRDVVLNRRILIVLLPALEKSPDELSNLGKVIIATMKAMMAAGLGEEVEGEYRDLIESKPTNSKTPFLCILDEYGYYAVQGFAVVPAQARSLGFSVVFAGQDLPAFQKISKEEALSIGANTNIKICMKLEDPLETWEFFSKTAGESYVTHTGGFQADTKSVTHSYRDTQGAQLEKRARIDLLDLKEQAEGEMHIFFKSKIVRARTFFADPPRVHKMRLNVFLKVDVPTDEALRKLVVGFEHFEKEVQNKKELYTEAPEPSMEIDIVVEAMHEDITTPPIERGVAALMKYREQTEQAGGEGMEEEAEEILPDTELNVFMPFRISDQLQGLLLTEDVDKFSLPLLTTGVTRQQIGQIERMTGKSQEHSSNIAREMIKDMQQATYYPPDVIAKPTAEELAGVVDELIDQVKMRKEEAKKEQEEKEKDKK